jgi:hypothetical protein
MYHNLDGGKMNKQKVIRQGDVYIILDKVKPEDLAEREDRTLALGEATGHHHTLTVGTVYGELDGEQWIVIDEPSELTHQEHDMLDIPIGVHEVRIQREYVPDALPRRVLD